MFEYFGGHHAFYHCTSLETIEVPASVTVMGTFLFEGCTNLKTVRIPGSLSYIGNNTFADCPSITRVDFNGTVSRWELLTSDITLGTLTQPHADFTVYCTDGEVIEHID